jgi:Kef-type K+ transport system membrane component KefB
VTFGTLTLITAVALLGPLLALPARLRVPVVVGELAAGVALGPTGFGRLDAHEPVLAFLADVGFALVMFVAGTHVPMRDPALRRALRPGVLRAAAVGAVALLPAAALARGFHTGHTALYAVLMASSSAALILPVTNSLGLAGPDVVALLPQVAVADAAGIFALPLAVDPAHAGRAALGAAAVVACAAGLFAALRRVEGNGWRRRVHELSEDRGFALELRISLVALFGLATVATRTHVSIMLAGFSLGLAVAAVGEPRRVAHQLFAVTEGLFGPLFFVWLGCSLDLRQLRDHPSFILLGVLLGLGAVAAHVSARLTGQPVAVGALAAAQLGVPVAATTLGSTLGILRPGEGAALILGALVTIAAATSAGAALARASHGAPDPAPPGIG